MSFQNLPPMPKSLSGCLVPTNETGQTKPRPLPRSSPREPPPPPPVNESNLRTRLSSSLDTKLGTLRKEMVICFKINEFLEMQLKVKAGLRQLDMHLLNQLWSLQQSVQDLKVMMSDRSSVEMDLGSPQSSESWELAGQNEEYLRYLERLALHLRPDTVAESENISSSTSSISSHSNSEKI